MKPIKRMSSIVFLGMISMVLIQSGCTPGTSKKAKSPPWSVQMADAVMTRYDSLVHYLDAPRVKWQYDVAMLGQAIARLDTVDEKYANYLKDYMDYFVQDDGQIRIYRQSDYNLDNINPARGLFTLYRYTGEEKYREAIGQFIEQLAHQPRTRSDGFWHKKIYPWQMWLDGIYMSSPFMAEYAATFNQPAWFDTVVHQITLIHSKTYDPATGLLYHAWDESREQKWADPETGVSPHFWGRAIGWYMMALVDVLEFLPEDHPGYGQLTGILDSLSHALLKFRDETGGLWYQVVDMGGREGNYLETSCSAMFTYAFAKGARLGALPAELRGIAGDCFDSMVDYCIITDEDGLPTLKYTCGGAGLGGNPYRDGSYEYYIGEKTRDNDPKGVAPFIMAAIELGR
jgi:unsaturated rhamnogalacturonyl hydrolase